MTTPDDADRYVALATRLEAEIQPALKARGIDRTVTHEISEDRQVITTHITVRPPRIPGAVAFDFSLLAHPDVENT